MSSKTWVLKYSAAAVLLAAVIIGAVVFTNPILFFNIAPATSPSNNSGTPSYDFLVMLTDPPTVPAGTTVLNLTYSQVSLHAVFSNGTTKWVPISVTATVNLFSLVNMSQTIASTSLPKGTIVDKMQFTISAVKAKVNNVVYDVTTLTNQLTVSVANSQKLNQTSGVLFDFQPTLVQIQATNSTGGTDNYFVLVPSATATIIGNINQNHLKVGTIVQLGTKDQVKIISVRQEASKNTIISSASLSVKGNVTNFSVTLTNQGNTNATIFGLTLNGRFNESTWRLAPMMKYEGRGNIFNKIWTKMEHPESIPFKINGTKLVPLVGYDDDHIKIGRIPSLIIQPGKSVTLTFSGVIQQGSDEKYIRMISPLTAITPIPNNTYTIRLMGEGFQTFNVTAKTA